MKLSMEKGNLDFIFAFEFKDDGTPTIGHVILSDQSQFLREIVLKISSQFSSGLVIKIY